jgi:glycosyltransferase involved in cell wall biosynthesis
MSHSMHRLRKAGFSDVNPRGRPRIAVVCPRLDGGGGAESKAFWTAEALKSDYRVSLITMGAVDLPHLNEFYGTAIAPGEVQIIAIPIPPPLRNRFDALRGYRLARFCKKKASEFDVMISCYNVMDFGRRGIQFIADVSFDDRLRRALHPKEDNGKKFLYKRSPLRWAYLRFARVLSGQTRGGWRRNLTIANSRWSSDLMRTAFGVETPIIYPPVIGTSSRLDRTEKEDGFIWIGRIVPEKGIDRVIEILEGVRGRGWKVHLHILGKLDSSGYAEGLRQRFQDRADWIFWEGSVIGQAKTEMMARHKFGISGCENEAFGIGVGEMVKTGAIVWVPNGGGQVEIVKHPALIYGDPEDGIAKIDAVLRSPEMQTRLKSHLAGQSEHFSTGRYVSEIKAMVERFLKEDGGKKG